MQLFERVCPKSKTKTETETRGFQDQDQDSEVPRPRPRPRLEGSKTKTETKTCKNGSRLSRRFETKTQVSRTPSLVLTDLTQPTAIDRAPSPNAKGSALIDDSDLSPSNTASSRACLRPSTDINIIVTSVSGILMVLLLLHTYMYNTPGF